jgi:hypothetical protein
MQTLLRRTLQAGARLAPRAGVFAGAAALSVAAAGTASLDAPAPALSPAEFRPFKLTKVEKITHDTSLYRCAALLSRVSLATLTLPRSFALPDSKQSVGLPTASCMVTKCVRVERSAARRRERTRLAAALTAFLAAGPTSAREASR